MKRLFSSPDSAEVELLKNVLADSGILCEVRNRDLSKIVPAAPFYEELWVADDDLLRASELVTSWRHARPVQGSSWTCPVCAEPIEGQFSSCWNCGASREKAL